MRISIASIALAIATLLAVSCGTGETSERPGWLDLLARVPDTAEPRRWTVMNDYARVRDIFDIDRPSASASEDALVEYATSLFVSADQERGLVPAEMLGTGRIPVSLTDMTAELGFTIANVDMDVHVDVRMGRSYQFLYGTFDRDTVDRAVRTDPLFSDLLEEASYAGISYYTWGEDDEPTGRKSAVRPFGRGHRLAVRDSFIYWAAWTDGLRSMIDAELGKRSSLADLEEYQLLAEGLDELDTFTALFSDDANVFSLGYSLEQLDVGGDEELDAAIREFLDREVKLLPFEAFATGAGVDSDGPFVAVVLLNADDETALENVGRLERRIREARTNYGGRAWSDLIHDADISANERLVLAKLRSDNLRFWFTMVFAQESLLLSE